MSRGSFAGLLAVLGAAQALGNVIILPKKTTVAEPRTLMLYDCQADFLDSMRSWSVGKKSWCCKRKGITCARAAEQQADQALKSEDFDCQEAFASWDTEWSEGKKAWCCRNTGRGCGAELRSLLREPAAGLLVDALAGAGEASSLADGMPVQASAPAAALQKPHAESKELPPHGMFDCNADLVDWERAWAAPKVSWCCQNVGRGCRREGASVVASLDEQLFDCDAALLDWQREWSPEKQAWCCKFRALGCLEVSV